MLSTTFGNTEHQFHLDIPHLEPHLTLSKSTPELSSTTAVLMETKAKEFEDGRDALIKKTQSLRMQQSRLQTQLEEKLKALCKLCIMEAEITGSLPPEFPIIPGQPPPQVKKRIGTEFTFSNKFLEKDTATTNDAIERLELDIEIQTHITTAALKLADDKTLSKSVRKKHRIDYYKQHDKLNRLKDTLDIYRRERFGTRTAYSKTTEDVDDNSSWNRYDNGNTEPCYRTLPNPIRRHPVAPKPLPNYLDSMPSSDSSVTGSYLSGSTLHSADNSSISSSTSSVVTPNENKLHSFPSETFMSATYQSEISDSLSNGSPMRPLREQYLPANSVPHSFQRKKGSSVSPSTVASSDLASSCSSSHSSLHFNNGLDKDSGTYSISQDRLVTSDALNQVRNLDVTDYPSQLRKTYHALNGKCTTYGSLDRKKMIRKQNYELPNYGSGMHIQLAELTPSKFGSKRDSAVDSQDSPYQFEDSMYLDRPRAHHPLYQNANHNDMSQFYNYQNSSIRSQDIHSGFQPSTKSAAVNRSHSAVPREFNYFPTVEENSVYLDPPDSQQNENLGNVDIFSNQTSEMSEINRYSESLRNTQRKNQELNFQKVAPSGCGERLSDPDIRKKRSNRTKTQTKRSPSNKNCNDDAVDALFEHNNRHSNKNAFEYTRRNTDANSDRNSDQFSRCSKNSSTSSLSSSASINSRSQPLRFVKVTQNDSASFHDKVVTHSSFSSSPHIPDPYNIDSCSTLV